MELQLLEGALQSEIYSLAIALYILGVALKKISKINDRYIPVILGVCGVVFVTLYVFSTNEMTTLQEVCGGIFSGFVQGLLCAGAAVYANQVFKQWKYGKEEKNASKEEDNTNSSRREDEDDLRGE